MNKIKDTKKENLGQDNSFNDVTDIDKEFIESLGEPASSKQGHDEKEDKDVILSVHHLKQYFRFGTGIYKYNKAVHDVSFDIHRGEVLGLVGESGCGKTTTGRSIIKLYDITSGSVYFEGKRIGAGTRWNEKEIKFKKKSAEAKIKSLKEERDEAIAGLDRNDPSIDYQEQKSLILSQYDPRIDNIRQTIGKLVKIQEKKIALSKHDNNYCNKDYAKGKVAVVKSRFSPILHFAFFAPHSHNLKCASSLYSKLNSYAKRKWRLLSGDLKVQGDVFTIVDKYTDKVSSFFGSKDIHSSSIESFKKDISGMVPEINALLNSSSAKMIKATLSTKMDESFLAFAKNLAVQEGAAEGSFASPNSSCVKTLVSLSQKYAKEKLAFSSKGKFKEEQNKVQQIVDKYANKANDYLAISEHTADKKKAFLKDYSLIVTEINEAIDKSHFDDVDRELFERLEPVFLDSINALPIDSSPAPFVNKQKMVFEYFQELRLAYHSRITSRMQMIFQDPIASLDPRMTVKEIIAEGLTIRGIKNKKFINEKVNSVLKEVGLLPEHSSRYPHEFSGGQRQRIGIARALIMDPDLIIADEPISALDVSIQAQVINLLNELRHERNLSILFIAHDLSVVKYFCDRIAVMYFGNLVELAPSDLLFKHPLHPYTRSLLSAIPLPDPHYEKNRKRIEYNAMKAHDYSKDKPKFQLVEPNHFVRCNKKELEEYKLEIADRKD